jgi:hypothetical protein
MKARLRLVLACLGFAASACGGQHLINLGEGPDDAGGTSSGTCSGSSTATTTGGFGGTSSGGGPGGAPGSDLIPSDRLDLIDDMEDGDERLPVPPRDGRNGRWNSYNDGSPCAAQWPSAKGFFKMSLITPLARESSAYAARTYGQGFQAAPSGGWAAMELSFKGDSPLPDAGDAGLLTENYDAHAYLGITFYGRIGADTQTEVRVNLATPQTLPQGGTCVVCYDSFGDTITLSSDWRQYILPFGELQQRGFGDAVPFFDASHIYTVTFAFAGPSPFDLWIDDIAFYR